MNHNSRKSRIRSINKYVITLNNPTIFQFIHYFFGSNISQAQYSLLFLIINILVPLAQTSQLTYSESEDCSVMSHSSPKPWTVAHRTPQSMEFSRQEYWSGQPFPIPGDLPDPRIEPRSPALQADSLQSEPPYSLSHLNCLSYRETFDLQITEIYFSQFQGLGSPGSKPWQIWWGLVETHFLVHGQTSFHCSLTWQKELSGCLFSMGTNPIHEDSTFMI